MRRAASPRRMVWTPARKMRGQGEEDRAPRPWPRGAWARRCGGGSGQADVHLPGKPGGFRRTKRSRPGRAVQIARDPSSGPASCRQIAAADFLGARGERRGDFGRGRGCSGHGGPPLDGEQKKRPAPKRRPLSSLKWNIIPHYACGRGHVRRLGVRAVSVAVPVHLVEELYAPAGGEEISVENRSESSSSFFQRLVWSLPAT